MTTIVTDLYPKVSLEEFLPELRVEFPEVPDEMLMYYSRLAAIEICERAKILTRTITICLEPCVGNYLLEAPDCVRVVAIESICRHQESGCGYPVTRLTNRPCYIQCFSSVSWWEQPNIIWFKPAPSTREYADVRVCVSPSLEACEIDEVLATQYREIVFLGVRYRLYGIPRQKWSSEPMAIQTRQDFDMRLVTAGTDKLLGGQRGLIRMKSIFNGGL